MGAAAAIPVAQSSPVYEACKMSFLSLLTSVFESKVSQSYPDSPSPSSPQEQRRHRIHYDHHHHVVMQCTPTSNPSTLPSSDAPLLSHRCCMRPRQTA